MTEGDLNARLVRQPLYLRGAWGEDQLRFDQSGRPAKSYKAVPFTTAAIDIVRLQLSGDHLLLQGERVGLEFARDGSVTRAALLRKGREEQILIEIDAKAGDFAPALDAVFTTDLAQVPSACSGPWAAYAARHWAKPLAGSPFPGEPSTDGYENGTARRDKSEAGVTAPRLLQQNQPEFSEAARALGYSGRVMVSLKVGADGTPAEVAIGRPAGLGLDEQALAAVEQYRFSPAMKDGQPVPVTLNVVVSFRSADVHVPRAAAQRIGPTSCWTART